MSIEMIIAGAIFVGLFVGWVVLPSRIKKRHAAKEDVETREN